MSLVRHVASITGVLAAMAVPARTVAQARPATADSAVRVYLDCRAFCDSEFLRTELTYIDWVRDRQDADVHLLITSQDTGGG